MINAFICFVSRDRELAQQLIAPMEAGGMTVEPIKLRLGDRPVEKIKEGFSHADSGSLLLSPAFFKNPWPRSDLDELAAMAQPSYGDGLSIIWSEIDANLIASYSPALASITGHPADMALDEAPSLMQPLMRQMPMSKGISFEQTNPIRGGGDADIADSAALRDMLVTQFTESDLRDMTYDLGVNYEDFAGDTMNGKVRELVSYMRRSGRMDELVGQVEKRTYHAKW